MAKKLNRASVSIKLEALAPSPIERCWRDFYLSRKTICPSDRTLKWYEHTAGQFVCWLVEHDIQLPDQIRPNHVRSYLNEFKEGGAKENYVHNQARAIRTLLIFLFEEKYIPEPIKFKMPPQSKERLPYLTADQVKIVLNACQTPRDKALFMLMVDTGVRKVELINLNWGDVDLRSGTVFIARGKGGKSRTVVIGALTRRALISYARELDMKTDAPLFSTDEGTRLTENGLRSLLLRIGERAGIHVSPHALRRTFATLAIKAGMNPLHLQGLLGHTTLEMTRRYIQMVDDDLISAHQAHGPIDQFLKK